MVREEGRHRAGPLRGAHLRRAARGAAQRGQCEIGYWLFEHARGKGIATRIARFIADYGFSLGLERIEARVVVGNVASERVLERAGFTREGVLRSMPLRRGGRVDMTVFSLLPGE